MAKLTEVEIKELIGHMFEGHWPMKQLWQTMADHFYPERADFTITRNVGVELADNLIDSKPILVRRDLGNSLSAMLRDGEWFKMVSDEVEDHAGSMWMEHTSRRMHKLMNRRESGFVRASKQADHDYITFGQCVISVKMNKALDNVLYQNWHLRDCAWFDDEAGNVGGFVRKWSPTARDLINLFGEEGVHRNVKDVVAKTPFKRFDCAHLVIPPDMYRDDEMVEKGVDWVSIFIDLTNNHILQTDPMRYFMYVVPRFQTISSSPYAYSPATVIGLPEARCVQAMTHTLLEAAERYARPPIIATSEVVRGDVDLAPDGITWVDNEYDERLGAALRPMSQDRGGFPIGHEMRESVYGILDSAFYLTKINLPEINRDMTAYEVSERMKQFRRENLPLFAPIEAEYSGAICETTFSCMMMNNLFGSTQEIPPSIQGVDAEFKFESPLSQSEEEEKVTRFSQVANMLAEAVEYDSGVTANVDFDRAFRDAVSGAGAPSIWLTDEKQVAATRQMQAQQQQAQQVLEMEQMANDVDAA